MSGARGTSEAYFSRGWSQLWGSPTGTTRGAKGDRCYKL